MPITQKYVIYRRIGGTGDYPAAVSGGGCRGPTALNRVNCGGYDEWADNDGNGRYSSVQNKPVSLNRVGYTTSDPADIGGTESWSDADSGRSCKLFKNFKSCVLMTKSVLVNFYWTRKFHH